MSTIKTAILQRYTLVLLCSSLLACTGDSSPVQVDSESSPKQITVSNRAAYSGFYGLRLVGGTSIERSLSTKGFTKVGLSYARRTANLAADEYLSVAWSVNGDDWHIVETTQAFNWQLQTFNLDSYAANQEKLSLKFTLDTKDANRQEADIDDIKIVAL